MFGFVDDREQAHLLMGRRLVCGLATKTISFVFPSFLRPTFFALQLINPYHPPGDQTPLPFEGSTVFLLPLRESTSCMLSCPEQMELVTRIFVWLGL